MSFSDISSDLDGDWDDSWALIHDGNVSQPNSEDQPRRNFHAKAKCRPIPDPLPAPQYRHSLSRPRSMHLKGGNPSLGGLAAPVQPQRSFESQRVSGVGLSAPEFQQSVSCSLQPTSLEEGICHDIPMEFQLQKPAVMNKRPRKSSVPAQSKGLSAAAVTTSI